MVKSWPLRVTLPQEVESVPEEKESTPWDEAVHRTKADNLESPVRSVSLRHLEQSCIRKPEYPGDRDTRNNRLRRSKDRNGKLMRENGNRPHHHLKCWQ